MNKNISVFQNGCQIARFENASVTREFRDKNFMSFAVEYTNTDEKTYVASFHGVGLVFVEEVFKNEP